jgi:hypothetical protein
MHDVASPACSQIHSRFVGMAVDREAEAEAALVAWWPEMAERARELTPRVPWERVIAGLIAVRHHYDVAEEQWVRAGRRRGGLAALVRWGACDLSVATERALRTACEAPRNARTRAAAARAAAAARRLRAVHHAALVSRMSRHVGGSSL